MRSTRLPARILQEVVSSLSDPQKALGQNHTNYEQSSDVCESRFPSLTIAYAVGQWQVGEDKLLSIETPRLGGFQGVVRKDVYHACGKASYLHSLARMKVSGLMCLFGPDSSLKGYLAVSVQVTH